MRLATFHFAMAVLTAAALAPQDARADTLTLFVSGEELATSGFQAPHLTRDGWALEFSRILVTLDDVTAWQTDPPFMADGPDIAGTALPFGGPFTVDLVDADDLDQAEVASVPAAPGHYNALSWTLAPASAGEFVGHSLVLEGTARRNGADVAFTLAARSAVAHSCGEYVGELRKGFVGAGRPGEVQITLHLDHLFGRADRAADDPMNLAAPGFEPFAGGGMQEFTMEGLHVGHVGEGHCHVAPR